MNSSLNSHRIHILRDAFATATPDVVTLEKTTMKGIRQSIELTISEFAALEEALPWIIESKDACLEQVQAAVKNPKADFKPKCFRKTLSRSTAAAVSIYTPDESSILSKQPFFVNISIRGYYMKGGAVPAVPHGKLLYTEAGVGSASINNESVICLRKTPGITFSNQEFCVFAQEVVSEISSKLFIFAAGHYHPNMKMKKRCALCRNYTDIESESESDLEPPAERRRLNPNLNDTIDYEISGSSRDVALGEVSKILASLSDTQSHSVVLSVKRKDSEFKVPEIPKKKNRPPTPQPSPPKDPRRTRSLPNMPTPCLNGMPTPCPFHSMSSPWSSTPSSKSCNWADVVANAEAENKTEVKVDHVHEIFESPPASPSASSHEFRLQPPPSRFKPMRGSVLGLISPIKTECKMDLSDLSEEAETVAYI
jgi:hypothetical protein